MKSHLVPTLHTFTPEDVVTDLMRNPQVKHEVLFGQLRQITTDSIAHADIVDNTFSALRAADHPYFVRSGETAVCAEELRCCFFPDITAVCEGPPKYEPGGRARLTNPALVVEVLSAGKPMSYVMGEKFSAYRKFPSLREYVLIDSTRCLVETYFQEQDDLWRIGTYSQMNQLVHLSSLGIVLPVAAIYAGVRLEVGDGGR